MARAIAISRCVIPGVSRPWTPPSSCGRCRTRLTAARSPPRPRSSSAGPSPGSTTRPHRGGPPASLAACRRAMVSRNLRRYDSLAMGECREEDLWIAGERVPARSGRYASVADPATGEALARVAEAGVEDVGAAVAAARRSFEHGEWRRAAAAERARVLLRLADLLRAGAEDFAVLESRSVGKPIQEA